MKLSAGEECNGELDGAEFTIADLVSVAKDKDKDIVKLLKEYITVAEVAV